MTPATPPRDDLDREAIAELARDWAELSPTERRNALRSYPELAAMGFKPGAPFADPADAARQERSDAQCRALDGTDLPAMGLKVDAPFADPDAVAREEESSAQLRVLDGSAQPDDALRQFADPATGGPGGGVPHAELVSKWVAAANLPPEIAAAHHGYMVAALGAMPERARNLALDAIGQSGGGVTFHPDMKALRAKYLESGGAKRDAHKILGFVLHRDGSGHAHVHIDGARAEGETDPQYTQQGIYLHELGHAADAGHRLSGDKTWHHWWSREIYNGRHLLTRYAREDPSEGLAELVRYVSQFGTGAAAAKFPGSVKYLTRKGLL